MSKNLFSSFDSVGKAQWKAKIAKDLKGKDYNETLLWDTEEGIIIDPIYHSEDLQKLLNQYENFDLNHEIKEGNNWRVLEKIIVEDSKSANKEALDALENGAEAIEFDLQSKVLTKNILDDLIEGILIEIAPVSCTNFSGTLDFEYSSSISFNDDVLTKGIAKKVDLESGYLKEWKERFKNTSKKSISIDGFFYQHTGAKIIEQLAFALSIGNEYLNHLNVEDLSSIQSLNIKMAVGSNFFFEISKFRALRKLFKVLLAQYQIEEVSIIVQAESSLVNKEEEDVNRNMLRNTSECIAAVVGGADNIYIKNHDYLTADSENGKRWARNISHILRNESYFNKVNDATKGAYYIENLTDDLAEKSWELFKHLESEGGFIKSLVGQS